MYVQLGPCGARRILCLTLARLRSLASLRFHLHLRSIKCICVSECDIICVRDTIDSLQTLSRLGCLS